MFKPFKHFEASDFELLKQMDGPNVPLTHYRNCTVTITILVLLQYMAPIHNVSWDNDAITVVVCGLGSA